MPIRFRHIAILVGLGWTSGALAQDELPKAEMALFEEITSKPVQDFIPVVKETLTELGCSLDMNDEAEFERLLTSKVAADFGHTDELSPLAVQSISFALRGAGMMMVGAGDMRLNDADNTATLIDCEAEG